MIGYGLAKAAVHQLVGSLAAPGSGMPEGSKTVAILPVTLDTPNNRKFIKGADTSTWTPLSFVATLMEEWITGKKVPEQGSLNKLVTVGGESTVEIV